MKKIVIICAMLLLAVATQAGRAQSESNSSREQRIRQSREQISKAVAERDRLNQLHAKPANTPSPDPSMPFSFQQALTSHQLFRGDSVTVDGVTATWEFTEKDKATSDTLGRLRFVRRERLELLGASTTVELNGDLVDESGRLASGICFYLAPIAFEIAGQHSNNDTRNLMLHTKPQPDHIKLTAEEIGTVGLYVSHISPIYIQQERWLISDQPKKYPDGKQIYQLEIRDSDNKLKAEIPLTDDAFLEVGRYRIQVEQYVPETQTARLAVTIRQDQSMKGRWSVVKVEYIYPAPVQKMLDAFANAGGFQIVWEAAPGHPESVDYIKNYVDPSNSSSKSTYSGTVDKFTKYLSENHPGIQCEWVSDTELKVSPKDYEKVVAEQAKKVDLEKENEEVLKKFDADYRLETKVYPLRTISVETAKAMVNWELQGFKVVKGKDDKYIIVPVSAHGAAIKDRAGQEIAIADEKSNSLILTAFPKTHEKIAALLQKIDESLVPAASTQIPDRFQIEAILLRGDTAGSSTLPSYLSAKDLETLGVKSVTQTGRAVVALAAEKGELGKAKATLGEGYGVELTYQDMRKPYLIVRGSLTGATGTAPAANDQVLSLDVGNQRTVSGVSGLNDLAITLDQVIEARDKHGDAAKLEVGTKTLEIKELETVSVPIYGIEITADSIEAEPGPHNGRARLRVRLLPEAGPTQTAKSIMLLENTVFLEPGKPALLGLTNMREALILVLRWQK